jgi:hypothetical protein
VQEVAAIGGNGGVIWPYLSASPYFDVQDALQTCTPCFHTSRASFPHPEFSYELSMACALMAWYLLESSKCGSSGQSIIRALASTW